MSKKRSPLSFNLNNPAVANVMMANVEPVKKPEKPVKEPAGKASSRVGRQFIAAHVNPEAAKQFKLLAIQKDMTTQALLLEAINDVFAKNGVSRIAEE